MKIQTKNVLIVFVCLLLLITAGLLLVKNDEKNLNTGWMHYSSPQWGVSFDYPASWEINEQRRTQKQYDTEGKAIPVGALTAIGLRGDGYTVSFFRHGIELSRDYKPIAGFTISGYEAKAWESETNGDNLVLSVEPKCGGLEVGVFNEASTSKEVAKKIIDSIVCTQP